MRGKLTGVGVGPGDPELLTLKAVKIIKEAKIVALPGKIPAETAAYRTAVQAVPSLAEKTLVPVEFPMLRDEKELRKSHQKGAETIKKILDTGKNVVFLTLGDVTIYSTFTYIQDYLRAEGYETELINGIPSFCAAAAALNISLAGWNRPLHIIPAVHKEVEAFENDGNYVLMKSGKKIKELKERLRTENAEVFMVENCTLPDEKRYFGIGEIPDESGYFSLVIAKMK